MTESGNPRDNAIAERVNGILKTEWLNAEKFISVDDARKRIAEVINTYNSKRPHLSLEYHTPDQAHDMSGIQKKMWKNYYHNQSKDSEMIMVLTT